jgi:hypothetical protein
MHHNRLLRIIKKKHTSSRKEPEKTVENNSGYVRPKRIDKWPDSMIATWWWWWWLLWWLLWWYWQICKLHAPWNMNVLTIRPICALLICYCLVANVSKSFRNRDLFVIEVLYFSDRASSYNSGRWPTWRLFSVIICLFESSTCFEQLCAHPQEDNGINTTSGIITLC